MSNKIKNVKYISVFGSIGKQNKTFLHRQDGEMLHSEEDVEELYATNADVMMRTQTNLSFTSPLSCIINESNKIIRCEHDVEYKENIEKTMKKKRGRPSKIKPEDAADAFLSEKDRLRKKLD